MELTTLLNWVFIILALGSAVFWFTSASVKFRNNDGTNVRNAFDDPLFKTADPEELMAVLSKQSKWNSWAASLAGLAAIVGAIISLIS